MSKFQPVLDNTSYLFSNNYVHDYLQSQIGTIGACYIMYARGMQHGTMAYSVSVCPKVAAPDGALAIYI